MRSPRRAKPLKITKIDNVWMKLVDRKDRKRLLSLLSYEKEWWEDSLFKCEDCGHLVTKREAAYCAKKIKCSFGEVPCLECGSLERWFLGKKKIKKRKTYQVPMVNKGGVFYAGFLPYLQERFDIGMDFEQESEEFLWTDANISLRPYQLEALGKIESRFRGQVSQPTGTGKTILAAAVLASLFDSRALFVVHTKDLLWQTKGVFEKLLGERIGIVGDGQVDWKRITVGMIQSLKDYSFGENPVDIVMVDEVHHVPAETYVELLEKIDCPVRLGFSGTVRVDREGWLKSMGLLGPVLYHYSYQDAVRDGWLAQAHVKILKPSVSLDGVKGTYRQVYNEGIIRNEVRNRLIVVEALTFAGRSMTCLVIVKEVQHGLVLEGMFDTEIAVFIHGSDESEQRIRVKGALESKDLKICICTGIFEEGVDIPSLDGVIIAGGGLSQIKAVQRVGRGLRKTEEKSEVAIVDFMDSCHKYLRKHSKERIKVYRSKGWIVDERY